MTNIIDLEYPYYKYFYKLNIQNIKNIVKKFKINISTEKILDAQKYKNKYYIIIDNFNDNYELNTLTDYFTENIRVKCKFANYISPLEYWNKNKNNLIQKSNNIYQLRELIFQQTKLCNNFRISVILTILKKFKCKKYLDISAGWGDRLLGAILHKCKIYCSVDPNEELHIHYQEIINTFLDKNKQKNYILINDGFETAKLPDIKFDLVFSSPPFFLLEKYSKNKNDSTIKYTNEKLWCNNFLLVSLYKAINHLEKNGHLILYIHYSKYVKEILDKINNIMEYQGIIYFYENKLRGMYVWKKHN
jgi:tRNA1(Val) A37 N6-methylase TrmN6